MTLISRSTPREASDLYRAYDALSGLTGSDLLTKALLEVFPGRVVTVSSFGAESAVLLDLIARIDHAAPVLFLDTGKHFPETLAYRDLLTDRLRLTGVRSVQPTHDALAPRDPDGTLHRRDPDGCCDLRKVSPLDLALDGVPAWISGRKRFQGGARAALESVEWEETPEGVARLKLNPLAGWTPDDIDAYFENYGLPRHPLWEVGYPSIGCAPCTAKPAPGDDPRAGRWAGSSKRECGIHSRARPAA